MHSRWPALVVGSSEARHDEVATVHGVGLAMAWVRQGCGAFRDWERGIETNFPCLRPTVAISHEG